LSPYGPGFDRDMGRKVRATQSTVPPNRWEIQYNAGFTESAAEN
jgi:hypothetical protein